MDPLEERRLRLEQAEREARGDFSQSTPNTRPGAPPEAKAAAKALQASSAASEEWAKYRKGRANDEDDDDSVAAQLNRQHNNFRAQAKIDLGLSSLLDTSLPREER